MLFIRYYWQHNIKRWNVHIFFITKHKKWFLNNACVKKMYGTFKNIYNLHRLQKGNIVTNSVNIRKLSAWDNSAFAEMLTIKTTPNQNCSSISFPLEWTFIFLNRDATSSTSSLNNFASLVTYLSQRANNVFFCYFFPTSVFIELNLVWAFNCLTEWVAKCLRPPLLVNILKCISYVMGMLGKPQKNMVYFLNYEL